ncbi:MAG: FAD-dependent oxidoreductase, partial [Burkholderiaceae bacterium]
VADLGPTWVWPDYQPVAARWLADLQIPTYPQFSSGQLVFDHGPAQPPTRHDVPAQEGSMCIVGGPQSLINRLVDDLPDQLLHLNSPVTSVTFHDDSVLVNVQTAQGDHQLSCHQLVVAIPPRIAQERITWVPSLAEPLRSALSQTPTWMSAHAKAVALFEHPYWRDCGLSGRLASHCGPIAEGHDHCGPQGHPAAIFGFIGWPAIERRARADELKQKIHEQLIRCFGASSPAPLAIHIQDWATESRVTTGSDIDGQMSHPAIRPDILRHSHQNHRLWFAGAETASLSPGLIEGALDSAQRIARSLLGQEPN